MVGVVVTACLSSVVTASAVPVDDKRAEAAKIAARQATLVQTAERLNEQAKASQDALELLGADLATTEATLSQRDTELQKLSADQFQFALKSYVYGESPAIDVVGVVAGLTQLNDASVREGYAGAFIGLSADTTDNVKAVRQDISQLEKSLLGKQRQQSDLNKQLIASQAKVASTQAELNALAKQTDAELVVLVREESARQEQQRMLQEKQAAEATAAAAAAQASDVQATVPQTRLNPAPTARKPAASAPLAPRPVAPIAATLPPAATAKPSSQTPTTQRPSAPKPTAPKQSPPTVTVPDYPAPSAGAATAIAAAKRQLGKPYVFGTNGPDTFDCSGLTQWAWAKAGVSMSHYTVSQFNEFPHVPLNALQPGDLVFFKIDLGHMGMYLGGGLVIHAPQTGDVVKISPISNFNVVGAARPG